MLQLDAEDAAEVSAGDDGDTAEGAKGAKVTVVGHDEVGFAGDGAFEDAVIIGIGGDRLHIDLGLYHFCDAGKRAQRTLHGILINLESPQHLAKLGQQWRRAQ